VVNFNKYPFLQEVYTVERTVEVVVDLAESEEPTTIRIEVLRDEQKGNYLTRAYRQETMTTQPTYPKVGVRSTKRPEDHELWLPYDLAWTDRPSADQAMEQALSFLKKQCRR
jgi:hypothetical protein